MAYATNYYTGDNSTKTFAFSFPYLAQAHVKAYVNGAAATFTFSGSGQVTLDNTPATGAAVQVRRETPVATPLVTFSNGSAVQGGDLNNAILQELYGLQEADDRLAELGSSYTSEVNARAAADTAETNARVAAVSAEAKARSDADTAETNARVAAINSEASTRASADSTASSRLDSVESKVQTLQNNQGSASNQSYTASNGGVARTVALKLGDTPDLRDYGATGGGTTDASAAFATALSALAKAGGGTLAIREAYLISPSSATTYGIPSNVTLDFGPVGTLKLGSTATLNVIGAIRAAATRIFDLSAGGAIVTSAPNLNPVVYPEWWGAVPGAANVKNADSAPAINAAARFVESYGGTVKFSSGSYTCLSGLTIVSLSKWSGATDVFPDPAANQTTLDFSYASAGTRGLTISNGGQVNMPVVESLCIYSGAASANDGSFGVVLQGVYRGRFTGLSINGFDQGVLLNSNSLYAPFENRFDNCYILKYKTRAVYAVNQSTTLFYNCDIIGAATNETIYIAAPTAATGSKGTQDTFTLDDCRVGANANGYPNVLMRILGGFWHTFMRTDFETALNAAINLQLSGGSEATPTFVMDNCWFDDSGIAINSSGNVPHFKVVNCARMLANPAATSSNGTATPGAIACIAVSIPNSTAVGSANIVIEGNDMLAQRADAQAIFLNNVTSARIIGNRIRQSGDAEKNSAINLFSNTSACLVMGNVVHSTNANPIANNNAGNSVVNNITF